MAIIINFLSVIFAKIFFDCMKITVILKFKILSDDFHCHLTVKIKTLNSNPFLTDLNILKLKRPKNPQQCPSNGDGIP
jgi:hypothetical protein